MTTFLNAPIIVKNPEVSIVDLEDGVAGIEFHSKFNALGEALPDLFDEFKAAHQARFNALVIGSQGPHFSAGANLSQILEWSKSKAWKKIDFFIARLQSFTSGLKTLRIPVVAACRGYALGAGCETALAAAHVVAHEKIRMGLPEIRVGLIPSAGGCKEMLMRHLIRDSTSSESAILEAWRTLIVGSVSLNARQARELRYLLEESSSVIGDEESLLQEAKSKALALHKDWKPPSPRKLPVFGASCRETLEAEAKRLQRQNVLTAHDLVVAHKIAWVLTGGALTQSLMTEQDVLDLERQALVDLCQTSSAQARMDHMLRTGKPLRN